MDIILTHAPLAAARRSRITRFCRGSCSLVWGFPNVR
jgi:hypothetical protein